MNCKGCKDLLVTDFIDDELDAAARRTIEEHLAQCPDCRAWNEALAAAVTPLRNAGPVPPPDLVWQRIRHRLERRRTPESTAGGLSGMLSVFGGRWIGATAMASLIAGMLLAGTYFADALWQRQQTTEPELENVLELTVFNDVPNEQMRGIYGTLVGGYADES